MLWLDRLHSCLKCVWHLTWYKQKLKKHLPPPPNPNIVITLLSMSLNLILGNIILVKISRSNNQEEKNSHILRTHCKTHFLFCPPKTPWLFSAAYVDWQKIRLTLSDRSVTTGWKWSSSHMVFLYRCQKPYTHKVTYVFFPVTEPQLQYGWSVLRVPSVQGWWIQWDQFTGVKIISCHENLLLCEKNTLLARVVQARKGIFLLVSSWEIFLWANFQ